MHDAYKENPKLGDAATVTEQLDKNSQVVDQLLTDINKYEVGGLVCSVKL